MLSLRVAGAAAPITIGEDAMAMARGPPEGIVSMEDSCRGPAFRAESAANGETKFGRLGATASVRRVSAEVEGTMDGRAGVLAIPAGPPEVFEEDAATSLSNCSIGSRRCAWAIFS